MRKMSLPLNMGTPAAASALGRVALVLIAVLAGACGTSGTGGTVASSSRQGPPSVVALGSPSPVPGTNPLGVLFVSPLSGIYTVSLVGIDGRVVASAQASRPVDVSCANAAVAVVPVPVSTSNTRVYFMDDKGVVRFLDANGDAGRATTVPVGTPTRRSLFAVSPDDQRIAVIVVEFTSNGASTKLYVEDLNGGGHHLDIFSDSGAFTLWPTGWHGTNNLVVAKVPACNQGGGPFCCGPQEFHVVDPGTAVRRFTVGGPACVIVGPPSPAGAVCEDPSNYQVARVVNWTGVQTNGIPIGGPTPVLISPDGQLAAIGGAPTTVLFPSNVAVSLAACGWIDNSHLLSGGDAQHQPSVGNVVTGQVVPVQAVGDCAGRIPGGL
jgi:hypothetical protein